MLNGPTLTILVASIAFQLAACGRRDRFIVVKGAGYEGAIIPAALVTDRLLSTDEFAWTPSADDVQVFEVEFQSYLRHAVNEPLRVDPPLAFRPDHPPRSVAELRELVAYLPELRRQYVGIAHGDKRELMAMSFPAASDFSNWRNEIMGGLDYGCGMWTAVFDVSSRRMVRFHCQGEA